MNEYFKLHGLDCGKKLREKIDRAFRPLPHFSPERYAEIVHNQAGECPLLMNNKLCEIHSHLGEAVLPSICRYYPRGPKSDLAFECSTTNSCERTLELLFENNDYLSFENKYLSFQMPKIERTVTKAEKMVYQSVRTFCFQLLQNRLDPLPNRLLKIGKVLLELDRDITVNLETIDLRLYVSNRDIHFAYPILFNIADWFIETNQNLSKELSDIKSMFINASVEEMDLLLQSHFQQVLPSHEIHFEKMLMNNLFFRQFPFQEYTDSFYEEFVYLCGAYMFTRYLALGYMRDKTDLDDFIDIMAKTFRVIAHTRFERNIYQLLKRENAISFEALATLIQL